MTNYLDILPTRTVYSLYFPEVRKIISEVTQNYPHEVYLRSINPGLDGFHDETINSFLSHFGDYIPGISSFSYQYYTAGASEGIFHTLAAIKGLRSHLPLYQFHGEYEGYSAYGKNIGLTFSSIPKDHSFKSLPPGIFFVSNPSAIDGNILPPNLIDEICNAGHEVVLDLSYLGCTKPVTIPLENPKISVVLTSLSKPFGLYYYRVGFAFQRFSSPTLEANKWFKNILSCIIGKEVLNRISPFSLYNQYKDYQIEHIKKAELALGTTLKASDIHLLCYKESTLNDCHLLPDLKDYIRGDLYRFCLTPYFQEQKWWNL